MEAERVLETLMRVGTAVSAELDTRKIVQTVTDAGTELSGAKFGAFFFNSVNEQGESLLLYTLSGAPREAFERFGVPRSTAVFAPTFSGESVVRSDDITKDPRYGRLGPHYGMPEGHLPVRSYLAVPVLARSGEVLGGLVFGHPEAGVFIEQAERLVSGIAAHAAVAIENARLYENAEREIAERKRTEQALRDSEERFRMIADNMDQLAWTCDKLGNVTWYNRRWLDYTGLSFEDMQGWDWSKVQHPDHLARVFERVKRSADTGEPWEDTFPLRGRDGQYRWFLSRALPIRDEQGNILRWFGTNTDVTEQRDAEEALRDANRRKDEFLATLAHELRNPLAPIRNAVELLRRKRQDDPELRWSQDVIVRQVEHLTRLIDDLLDVSRITNNKLALRKRRVELAEIIQAAVESSRQVIEQRDHELTVTLPSQPVYLNADLVRLAQVFMNLLSNAAKYTERGGRITLTAELASPEHQPAGIVVRVKDTGVGIAAEELSRLFEMFFQVNQSLKRSQGGLGIGLSLARLLAELHGGSVEARSQGVGRGSEFIVRLPVLAEDAKPRRTQQRAGDGEETAPPARRILVVDDNQDSADSLAMLLRLTGNEVHTAYDGEEGVAAAARVRPDVVLLDLLMPKLNGHDACRHIREQSWGKGMALIALTGLGQDEDRRHTEEAGFDSHMVKPVDPPALMKLIASLSPEQREVDRRD